MTDPTRKDRAVGDGGAAEAGIVNTATAVADSPEELRLNLGAGETPLSGYDNLDIKDGHAAYPLMHYADNSVQEVRASHILEHFAEAIVPKVIDEWVRVLKVGGLLKVAVPDFEWVSREYGQDPGVNAKLTRHERDGRLRAYTMGGQTDPNDFHRSAWDKIKLTELLDSARLTDITEWQSEIRDCASLPVSLNLQGRKAPPQEALTMRVAGVMSVPRFMLSANMGCALQAFFPLRIPLNTHTGAFWHQTLTNVMEKTIGEGVEYIITLDYDTIFTKANLVYLLRTMAAHPEFDALMGAQCKREGDHPLLTQREPDGSVRQKITVAELCTEFVPAASGHFGLTVFRAEKIATLSKPWFVGVPDKNGEWHDKSKLDADMYFWKKWRDEGRNLHLAQKVRLGHIQDMVVWPRMDFVGLPQYMSDFREKGMPEEARYQCPQSDS